MDKRLAFEVFIDDLTCITFAPTAKAAQYNAVLNAREAGYYNRRGQWPNCKAKRAPLYDDSPLKDQGRRTCWIPEYVRGY